MTHNHDEPVAFVADGPVEAIQRAVEFSPLYNQRRMRLRNFGLVGLALIAMTFAPLIQITPAKADVPFTAVASYMVTVTNVATRASTLIGSTTTGECFKVANPTTALVCLGDSTVGAATTTGTHCWPICVGGAYCAEGVTSIPYSTYETYLRAPVNTVVAILVGNGCGAPPPT